MKRKKFQDVYGNIWQHKNYAEIYQHTTSTHTVFLASSTVCYQVRYLGAEVLPYAATHSMNKISQQDLQQHNQPQKWQNISSKNRVCSHSTSKWNFLIFRPSRQKYSLTVSVATKANYNKGSEWKQAYRINSLHHDANKMCTIFPDCNKTL